MSIKTANKLASATSPWSAGSGLAGFIAGLIFLRTANPFPQPADSALFLMLLVAACVFAVDLAVDRVHRRASTGLDFSAFSPNPARALVKLCGLAGSVGMVALAYWLFPEYHDPFYVPYFTMLRKAAPLWLLVAVPYFFLIDACMANPRDGYWHMGMAVLLRFDQVDARILTQHLLGWGVKWFFLPLMFIFLCNDIKVFLDFDFRRLDSPKGIFDFMNNTTYFIDVVFGALGYVMSFRLTDTHIRSVETTMLGWVVALVCYPPISSVTTGRYLAYETGKSWEYWFWSQPGLYSLWTLGILILVGIYAWSTIVFGCRFSNLTHRGIITHGPYRWTKHPAYLCKNLSWWMVSLPFLADGSDAMRKCLLLLGLNAVYAARAWTEERHLSLDPAYVAYAHWIDEHGLFRALGRRRRDHSWGWPRQRSGGGEIAVGQGADGGPGGTDLAPERGLPVTLGANVVGTLAARTSSSTA